MTPGKSIQFTTPEEILLYYREQEIPAFAIWHNGNRSFRFEGEDAADGESYLTTILATLTRADSAAIYTLALYSRPKNAADGWLTTKREAELSANFRLRAFDGVAGIGGGGAGTGVAALLAQIQSQNGQILQALKTHNERLEALEDEDDDEPADNGFGFLGELAKNEDVQKALISMLTNQAAKPPAISGIPPKAGEVRTIEQSIQVLANCDRNLAVHLDKLSRIAETDAAKFKMLLSMLATL